MDDRGDQQEQVSFLRSKVLALRTFGDQVGDYGMKEEAIDSEERLEGLEVVVKVGDYVEQTLIRESMLFQ